MRRYACRCLPLLLALAGVAAPAQAVTYCVGDISGLRTALDGFAAADSGSTVTIKLQQGSYDIDNTSGQTLQPMYKPSGTVSLKLLGGYTANCTARSVNPANTVIDGHNQANSLLYLVLEGDLTVEGIGFTRMKGGGPYQLAAVNFEYRVTGDAPSHAFAVRYNSLRGNAAPGALRIDMESANGGFSTGQSGGVLQLVGNLISGNAARGGVSVFLTTASGGQVFATNNTVAGNAGSVQVDTLGETDAQIQFVDNVFWGNGATDLDFSALPAGASLPTVAYNTVTGIVGAIAPTASNSTADPLFVDAAGGNYHLKATLPTISPAVNSGAAYQVNGFPGHDLDGNPRLVGSAIDRGAYESSFDDRNDFLVTTAGDNGSNTSPTVGSLRWAIKSANAYPGASTIKFNLSGCPVLLNVASAALPDITTDVTVDGSSQPGATPNTALGGFDANLCVYLNGGGSSPWAFHTSGGGRLTVRGVGMAGFIDAAVKLESGTGNIVAGNQIGGIPFAAQNKDGVRISGSATRSYVGGFDDPAAVNLIVGNTGSGVYIDGAAGNNAVANNLIGLGADGVSGNGNNLGVYVFNAPNNVIAYNYVANNAAQGVSIAGAGSTGNVVQYNQIGLTAAGAPASNGSQGVLLSFAAAGNTIGASQGSDGGGNAIYASGAAVWVSPSGGGGNRVLANGLLRGMSGLSLDLGGAGPTANDAGDADTGPNGTQNYPVLLHSLRAQNLAWIEGVLDSAPNASYRLDFYWDTCCTGARGAGQGYFGHRTVVTDAAGHAHFWFRFATTRPTGRVSALATSAGGDTSEIGEAATDSVGDLIFRDDFQPQ